MPVTEKGEYWKKSRVAGGVEYALTKEFFKNQDDMDARVKEYKASIWKPRHEPDMQSCCSFEKALSLEIEAMDTLKDRIEHVLLSHLLIKVHHSAHSFDNLIAMLLKSSRTFIKGESVTMKVDDEIRTCIVSEVDDGGKLYTVKDCDRSIAQVPSDNLRRLIPLTTYDVETLVRITCTQEKGRPWLVDEMYKKEFGVKEKLAPIFCRPNGGMKEENNESPIKKKRESNDSLKENGVDKKTKKRIGDDENDIEKKKMKKDNVDLKKKEKEEKMKIKEEKMKVKEEKKREKEEKKKEKEAKKELKEEGKKKKDTKKEENKTNNVDIIDMDEDAPLINIMEKKQKQGFLDKFIVGITPGSSQSSTPIRKKRYEKMSKSIEDCLPAYKSFDPNFMETFTNLVINVHDNDIEKILKKAEEKDEEMRDPIEIELIKLIQYKKTEATLYDNLKKMPRNERKEGREDIQRRMNEHPMKEIYNEMKNKVRANMRILKIQKEAQEIEQEKSIGYNMSLGKLKGYGTLMTSPYFSQSLMISQFAYVRGSIFPNKYRLPMTDDLLDVVSLKGDEKIVKSIKVTFPIVKTLFTAIHSSERFADRLIFCDTPIDKMNVTEYNVMEMIRVLVSGEKRSTKEEREAAKDESNKEDENKGKKEVKKIYKKKDDDDEDEEDESNDEEGEGEDKINEDDDDEAINDMNVTMVDDSQRVSLLNAIDECDGQWNRLDGDKQLDIIDLLIHCYIDTELYEKKSEQDLIDEKRELKNEKSKLIEKIEEAKEECNRLEANAKSREEAGLRNTRVESGKIDELHEIMKKHDTKLIEVKRLLKETEYELSVAESSVRLDTLGKDRHGRMYYLMPHAAGLFIQSIGSLEWIQYNGDYIFDYVKGEEEWRIVRDIEEWNELKTILSNGTHDEKKLEKKLENAKEIFIKGLKWMNEVSLNKTRESNEKDENMDISTIPESIETDMFNNGKDEMKKLIEKLENHELLNIKDVSRLLKKCHDSSHFKELKETLVDIFNTLVGPTRNMFCKVFILFDSGNFMSTILFERRINNMSRIGEIILMLELFNVRMNWDYVEKKRMKEEKNVVVVDNEDESDEEDNYNRRSKRNKINRVDIGESQEVKNVLKKVVEAASGRLYSTLCSLEIDGARSLRDIEESAHRLNMSRLKKELNRNMIVWREEIEDRMPHRLNMFDKFVHTVEDIIN